MKKSLLITVLISFLSAYVVLNVDAPAPGSPPAEAPLSGSSRLATLLGNDAQQAYPQVLEPRDFRFPEDHGPHPE